MPIFFSLFIVFCFWLTYEINKSDKLEAKYQEDFFANERKANLTRKQSTDDLVRITLPDDFIFHPENDELNSIECKLKDTFSHEIINLTGYTNTDLKLAYGRANIDYLSECDGYFTKLVTQLQSLASALYENELHEDCKKILDFAISIKADNSYFFVLRAKYYIKDNQIDNINNLIDIARSLNTISSSLIVDKLENILIDSLT